MERARQATDPVSSTSSAGADQVGDGGEEPCVDVVLGCVDRRPALELGERPRPVVVCRPYRPRPYADAFASRLAGDWCSTCRQHTSDNVQFPFDEEDWHHGSSQETLLVAYSAKELGFF